MFHRDCTTHWQMTGNMCNIRSMYLLVPTWSKCIVTCIGIYQVASAESATPLLVTSGQSCRIGHLHSKPESKA
jgi:hypothetical protein